MVCKNWIAGAVLAAAAFAPDVVRAQGPADLLLPVPTAPLAAAGRFGRASPGVSSSSPLAFGPNYRDVFAGIGYQASSRYTSDADASASAGFGLGDASRIVGVEIVITSLSTVRSGLFDRTVAGFKVHRNLPGNTAIALGVEGLKLTGNKFETKSSVYAVASRVFALRDNGNPETPFSIITGNVGLGNGRFCAESAKLDCSLNVFASAGLRANKYAGLIADWTGQDLNLGVSLALVPNFPLVITPALADITGSAGDKVRFTLGAGFGLHF